MRTETITLTVSGKGDTRERSLGDVFRKVPEMIRARVAGTPFRIEPVGLEIEKAVEFRSRERFLGVFFPRTRTEFRLTARVVVEVSALDVDSVDFVVKEEALTTTQHLLQLR